MTAYAARKKQDQKLAAKAWNLLLDDKLSHTPLPIKPERIETWTQLEELPWVTTNTVSQWCLNVIAALELIGDSLPAKKIHPARKDNSRNFIGEMMQKMKIARNYVSALYWEGQRGNAK